MTDYLRIFLFGHPNTGKTYTVNEITGSSLKTGNYSGVTVEKNEISCKNKNKLITYIDLPGTKQLANPDSEDEKVAHNVVFNEITKKDAIIFFINLSYLESGLKDFELIMKKGNYKNILCIIDQQSSVTDVDLDFIKNLEEEYKVKFALKSKKSTSIKKIINEYICDSSCSEGDVKCDTNRSDDTLLDKIQKTIPSVTKIKEELTDFIDKIFLNKFLGIPLLVLTFYSTIRGIFIIGEQFESITSIIYDNLSHITNNYDIFLVNFIFNAFGSSIFTIINTVPILLGMFLFLFIIERTGYLVRICYILDDILRLFNINGTSLIPLINGLGCSIPAYISTRIIANKKERLATMVAIGLIPCSAKIALFTFFTKIIFDKQAYQIMLYIYFFSFLSAFLVLKIFGSNSHNKNLIIEIPPYRGFKLKEILTDAYLKTKNFIFGAGKMIILSYSIIWTLTKIPYKSFENKAYFETLKISFSQDKIHEHNISENYILENSVLGRVSKKANFIFEPIGFDWRITLSLMSSMVAKEIAIGTLCGLYQDNLNSPEHNIKLLIDKKIAIAYIIFMSILFPCVSAISTFKEESGSAKITTLLIVSTFVISWIICRII